MCRRVVGLIPRNILIEAAQSKRACTKATAILAPIAIARGIQTGVLFGPASAAAGGVTGAAIANGCKNGRRLQRQGV